MATQNQKQNGAADKNAFARALNKPTVNIICSSPETQKLANAAIQFDKLLNRLQRQYALGRVGGDVFYKAQQRAAQMVQALEQDMKALRSVTHAEPRKHKPMVAAVATPKAVEPDKQKLGAGAAKPKKAAVSTEASLTPSASGITPASVNSGG